MTNPNDTATWRRRGGNERTLDNDGENNRDADTDRQKNLKRVEYGGDPASYPNRNRAGEPK